MILIDGLIGQMMESVDMDVPYTPRKLPEKTWAAMGKKYHSGQNVINSLSLNPDHLEKHNLDLQAKYNLVRKNEVRYELINMENPDYVIVAYGSMARIARSAIETLGEKGIHVGMIRPITVWPFPKEAFAKIPSTCKGILVVEMSLGQMVDDVEIANRGKFPIAFYGRAGGNVPDPTEVEQAILNFGKLVRL